MHRREAEVRRAHAARTDDPFAAESTQCPRDATKLVSESTIVRVAATTPPRRMIPANVRHVSCGSLPGANAICRRAELRLRFAQHTLADRDHGIERCVDQFLGEDSVEKDWPRQSMKITRGPGITSFSR
jgi:hypothetical protein